VRYAAVVPRALPPAAVFAQMLLGFELAAADPRVVAVNPVQPEDWHVPRRDYELHMRMFEFMHGRYPAVDVTLHAGELAFGQVPPSDLGWHVRRAVESGVARRIGHGADVMHDSNPAALLREMARRRIAVEINLTSNDYILGLRGARHPLRAYLRAGVPVVLSTDDEGVSRIDLTHEYQRAVEEHGLSYSELKQISRNGIEYSFLPPDEKARVLARLNAAIAAFERGLR
jgi:adenosine deaminase